MVAIIRYKDITGERFDRLVAVRPVESIKNSWRWEFRCDCGNLVTKQSNAIIRKIKQGRPAHCGCESAKYKTLAMDKLRATRKANPRKYTNALDITGERYGMLVAIKRLEIDHEKRSYTWLFECDCGGASKRVLSDVRRRAKHEKRILNCGCLDDEHAGRIHVERRAYIKTGKYGKDGDWSLADRTAKGWRPMQQKAKSKPVNIEVIKSNPINDVLCGRW